MTLRFTTFTVRHTHINAIKVTRENAPDVSRLVGGHMWASSVVLPDRTTASVGSWVCQTGSRSWAVLTDEEIARWWVEVGEHG